MIALRNFVQDPHISFSGRRIGIVEVAARDILTLESAKRDGVGDLNSGVWKYV